MAGSLVASLSPIYFVAGAMILAFLIDPEKSVVEV